MVEIDEEIILLKNRLANRKNSKKVLSALSMRLFTVLLLDRIIMLKIACKRLLQGY